MDYTFRTIPRDIYPFVYLYQERELSELKVLTTLSDSEYFQTLISVIHLSIETEQIETYSTNHCNKVMSLFKLWVTRYYYYFRRLTSDR